MFPAKGTSGILNRNIITEPADDEFLKVHCEWMSDIVLFDSTIDCDLIPGNQPRDYFLELPGWFEGCAVHNTILVFELEEDVPSGDSRGPFEYLYHLV